MTARAFIVAIEDYPNSQGMANQLPGTHDGANEFWRWLTEHKKLNKGNIVGCVSKDFGWRTTGTTRDEILAALDAMVNGGRDDTSELYFFFSGHGFSYTDLGWTRAIDVFVASDFVSQSKSGGSCIKLQEIQGKLWSAMGPGDHYYFVDACRNTTTHAKINVLDTGLVFTASELGKPCLYTLYSTVRGRTANVASGFVDALVLGLKGAGRAKGWQEDSSKMYVKFNLLVEYIEKKLTTQDIDQNAECGKGLILELIPTPESECVIKIDNASPEDKFELVAKTTFGRHGPFEFEGGAYTFKLPPYLYNIEITHPAAEVVRLKPPPPALLDLYDQCEVHFTKSSGAAGPAPQDSTLLISQPETPRSELTVENLHTGTVLSGRRMRSRGALRSMASGKPAYGEKIEPGTYVIKLRERGALVGRRKVTVDPGEEVSVDLLERPKSKIRETILKAVSNDPKAQVAVFSETQLGPTADWDLSLWLSIFGASCVIGSETEHNFKKLEKLALENFDDIGKNESCVYVLAGFEKSRGDFGIGLSKREEVDWEPMRKVKGLTSIYQWRAKTSPGSYLLSIQLPGQVPTTFSTYCLPNRATFVVFTEDESGRSSLSQYMLPIGHLTRHLDARVRGYLGNKPLSLVRYMSITQRQFARKRSLEPGERSGEEGRMWMELAYSKWLDPVMSLLAAYYFIRQGAAGADLKKSGDKLTTMNQLLHVMVGNLRTYFKGVPDIEVIAKLVKEKNWEMPREPPILLDGVLALGDLEERKMLPLPAHLLDYSGPWTAWRGAVNPFKTGSTLSAESKRGGSTKERKSTGRVASNKAASKQVVGRGAIEEKLSGRKRT